MRFHYKARNNNGESVEGVREAADRFALSRELKTEGFIVISAEAMDAKKNRWSFRKLNNMFGRVSLREKIVFANNLSAMITAGLSLIRAVGVLERQTDNQYFQDILKVIGEKVQRGESLSAALAAYPKIFPEVFVAMVAAGEESGNLPGSLKVVSSQMTKSYELRRKIRGAMIYPAIIIGVIIIIGILMMVFLVPTLTQTFKELEVELPLSTQIVVAISDFMTANIVTSLGGLVVLAVAVVSYVRTSTGRRHWHYLLLHLPVISELTRKVNSAIIMRTISSLIQSGVSMIDTLKITHRVVQNTYYKSVISEAIEKVQKGVGLSTVLSGHEKLFPVLVGEMALVGEETGDLPSMLMNGAVFFEEEVDQATKNLSTIIEPVLMVIIGIAVGFFAISMIGPIYSLSDAF